MAVMTKEDFYGGSFTAFPAGLRVLVVDNDLNCLPSLTSLLEGCHYRVTRLSSGVEALSLLRKNESKFDIVISDVFISDMDGFRFLEIIQLEMNVPVVMISNDNSRDIVLKVINMGACCYLVKPVRKEEISVIWQHVVRRNSKAFLLPPSEINLSSEDYRNNHNKSSTGEENCGSSSFHVRNNEEEGSKNDIVSLKKQRMVWTNELHDQFVAAVNSIGCCSKENFRAHESSKSNERKCCKPSPEIPYVYSKRTEKVGKKPCNIPSAQASNIMHPCMMGSSTSPSLQVVAAFPPPMSNQLHSQTSVVSQADIDEAEIFSAGGGCINGFPITYYTQPLGYGLQPPPPTAAIQETEPQFMESEQSLNDENGTIQFPLPISSVVVNVGQSNNHHPQQQLLGRYNLFSYDGCSTDATDKYASYATVGNDLQPEYTLPSYDSCYLLQHYDNNQEVLNAAHSLNIPSI